MVPILILAGTAVFVVVRRLRVVSRRRRPALRATLALPALPGAVGDIGLVAAREVGARVGGRVFRVDTVLMLAAAAAAIVIPVLEQGKRLPVIFAYFMATTTPASGSPSTLFEVLAYLPPTAPFAVTVLTALVAITWWQFAISVALTVFSTVGVARLATRVYRTAILRTGARVRLRDLVPLQIPVRASR